MIAPELKMRFWRRWMMEEEETRIMKFVGCVVSCGVAVSLLMYIGTDLSALVLCVYKQICVHHHPRRLASLVEIILVVALAIGHAIVNVKSGCFCWARVPRQSNVNRTAFVALICFNSSWLTFAAASLCYLVSAVFNLGYFRDTVKPSFFDNGALLATLCMVFDVLYCILYAVNTTSTNAQVIPPNQADIELGQPQLPPTNC